MDSLKSLNLLVTGASGMFGRHLSGFLGSSSKVTGVSRSGSSGALSCELSSAEEVRRLFEGAHFDLVIHAAAYSDVDGCERDPGLAHRSNALATRHIASACAAKGIPLIAISTDYVFDGRKASDYEENDQTGPVNIYGLTKLQGEFYAREICHAGVIVRTSWLFGADNPKNFVNAITDRLKRESVVGVLDDQENSPTCIKDLAEATARIGAWFVGESRRRPKDKIFEVFHVCNKGAATRYGMTLKIKEVLGLKNVRVERIEKNAVAKRLAVRPARSVLSTRRYESFFNTALRGWEESLRDYVSISGKN